MDQSTFENSNHVFIVRIWYEPREIPNLPAQWKGMVQHVVSGEQRYFNEIAQLTAFIVRKADLPKPHDFDPGK